MFARIPSKLPEDPKFPADIKKLGYFVDRKDEIKSIEYPDEYFQFWISSNIRYRERQREALHSWIRDEVTRRMKDLGCPIFYLPNLSLDAPVQGPYLPIYMTNPTELVHKKRIVVLVNGSEEDLGVFSYRILTKEGGINKGSCVGFAAELIKQSTEFNAEPPGLVILNPGQYLFSYKAKKAMTMTTWDAMPRKSAVHPAAKIDPKYNRIEGNASPEDHLRFVMKNILNDPKYVSPDAQLYIVGVANGANEVIKSLAQPLWKDQHNRIAALAFTSPTPFPKSSLEGDGAPPTEVLELLQQKSRTWTMSSHKLGEPLLDSDTPTSIIAWQAQLREEAQSGSSNDYGEGIPDEITLSPEVSGAETQYGECVMPIAWKNIVEWFGHVAYQGKDYVNKPLNISDEVLSERARPQLYVTPSSKGPWGNSGGGNAEEL